MLHHIGVLERFHNAAWVTQVEVAKSTFSFGGPDNEFVVGSNTDVGVAIQAALRCVLCRMPQNSAASSVSGFTTPSLLQLFRIRRC